MDNGKRALAVNEEEARIVKLIFTWYTVGDSESGPLTVYEIVKRLTEARVPTKGDTDPNTRKQARYGKWGHTTVDHILGREAYAGIWYYGKLNSRIPGGDSIPVEVPAIISHETWEAAQERKRLNKANARRNTKYNYLMRRHLTCGDCGTKMSARMTRNGRGGKGRGVHFYYFCPARRNPDYPQKCPRRCSFRADHVDAAVWEWVRSLLMEPKVLEAGLRAEQAAREESLKPLRNRLAVVDDLLADNRRQLERALDLYLSGTFEQEILTGRKEKLNKTIIALEQERHSLTQQLESRSFTGEQIESIVEIARQISKGLETADGDFDVRRHLIEALDVQATLTVENDQKVAYVTCMVKDNTLSIDPPNS
jgi:hypothetical protein